MSYPVCANLT